MPKITYVNENIKHVLGFEPKDFINNFELFKECLHPEDIQKVFDAIPKVMAKGRVILGEYRFMECGAIEESVDLNIERIKGFRNMFLGGSEGIFLTTLTGPGKIWLQTMPVQSLTGEIYKYFSSDSK